jgi:hypothetical protein
VVFFVLRLPITPPQKAGCNDNRERTPPLVRLKAVCGPGDEGEPVITVMMPDED